MSWNDDPNHPFAGIAEKLIRAKENISNLESEIGGFFEKRDYPVLQQNDYEVLLKAIEYHKNLVIPPRFGVLAGEIIHHLRSCFDHVVWIFSTGPQINNMPIDFPVFLQEPVKEKHVGRLEGKIQRIINQNVRGLIKRLQPYNAPNPLNDPLWIIHDLDIVDKHRELVFLPSTGSFDFPPEMKEVIESYERAHPELGPADIARHFRRYGTAHPSISFRNFGGREVESVIPGLTQLFNYTVKVVGDFAVL